MRFDENTVELSKGPLTYHIGGEGPAVIYLHAASGFRKSEAFLALSENYRLYAPVEPGYDGTPVLDGVA